MRFVLCLLVLGFLAPLSSAPAHAQWGIDLSATLGVSWASLSTDDDAVGGRSAFEGGVTARIEPALGPVALRSGLFFAQKGAAVDVDEGGEVRYTGNYVQLPLLLHATGPSIGIVTPYLQAGGYGAVKFFERQSTGGDGIRIPIETDASFFKRTDTGLLVGVGTELLFGDRPLGVTVRYAHGLVDVAQNVAENADPDDDLLQASFPPTAHTRTWTLSVVLGL